MLNSEELERIALRGEKAAQLLANEDLKTMLAAYDAMIAEQEQALAPLDKEKFTVLRAGRRVLKEFAQTFLEGVKMEGEDARAKAQGVAPEKNIIISG